MIRTFADWWLIVFFFWFSVYFIIVYTVFKLEIKGLKKLQEKKWVWRSYLCFKVSQLREAILFYIKYIHFIFILLWHSAYILYIVPENTIFLEVVSHKTTKLFILKHTEHCITIDDHQLLKGIKTDI